MPLAFDSFGSDGRGPSACVRLYIACRDPPKEKHVYEATVPFLLPAGRLGRHIRPHRRNRGTTTRCMRCMLNNMDDAACTVVKQLRSILRLAGAWRQWRSRGAGLALAQGCCSGRALRQAAGQPQRINGGHYFQVSAMGRPASSDWSGVQPRIA